MTIERPARPCRLCDEGTSVVHRLGAAPRAVQTLLTADALGHDRTTALTLARCPRCGLLQLDEDPDLDQLYSPEYLYSVNFSAHAREYQSELARRWSRDHALTEREVLEVGGGDGFFAELLTGNGCRVTLVDPARRACEQARLRGLHRVVEGYLDERTFAGEKFEAVVTRHVLEHATRPVAFLKLLGGHLGPGGRLFVEVPNLDGIVARGRCQDFYAEHLSYFSPRTLTTAFDAAGFETLEVGTSERGDYLVGVARVPERSLDGFLADTTRFVAEFRSLVEESRASGRRLAVWGGRGPLRVAAGARRGARPGDRLRRRLVPEEMGTIPARDGAPGGRSRAARGRPGRRTGGSRHRVSRRDPAQPRGVPTPRGTAGCRSAAATLDRPEGRSAA